MLRDITDGIELETEGDIRRGVLAVRMEMELEVDLRSSLDQPARSFREDVALLSDRVFVEEHSLLSHLERPIGSIEPTAAATGVRRLYDRGPDMVDDRVSL